ncbi:MAG: transcription elongation factor GreA [Acholeplasmatales bacterium]|nr:transcription elongation factor GreA [Acholeplasmatales bacterium]
MMNNQVKEATREYYEELKKELDERKNVTSKKILDAIKEAREQGDLSENADYASARENQAANEARILEIEEFLKHVKIIETTFVTVKYIRLNKVETYQICGSEFNPFEKKISTDSPLAKAVFGHKPGDKFFMTTESGKDIELYLEDVKNPYWTI